MSFFNIESSDSFFLVEIDIIFEHPFMSKTEPSPKQSEIKITGVIPSEFSEITSFTTLFESDPSLKINYSRLSSRPE